MPNNKGGKKKRRGKNMTGEFSKPFQKPEVGQYFAKAIQPLGSFKVKLEVYFYDIELNDNGKPKLDSNNNEILKFRREELIGNVRGSMRRRDYVNPGDIVLVSEREFTSNAKIVDIILKYHNSLYSSIKKHKFCPGEFVFNNGAEDEEAIFKREFSEDDSDDSIEKPVKIKRGKIIICLE